ncbi:ComEA family DNA-binding protein [Sphingobacterium lactis]
MKKLFAYFSMNRKEQLGVMVLLFLMCISVLLNLLFPILRPPKPMSYQIVQLANEVDSVAKVKETTSYNLKSNDKPHKAPQYVKFDPNTLPLAGWVVMGLSERQAAAVIKYRERGGKFNRPEDLAKMYTISPENYQAMLPYISIAKSNDLPPNPEGFTRPSFPSYPKKDTKVIIDINRADTSEWMKLRGIGPGFSRRIVKYRSQLGGFVAVDQLAEVYGLPPETLEQIRPQLMLTLENIQRLKINGLSAMALAKHPYVRLKDAKTIVNYRQHHGPFQSMTDLQKILSLDAAFFRKIELYLDFEN